MGGGVDMWKINFAKESVSLMYVYFSIYSTTFLFIINIVLLCFLLILKVYDHLDQLDHMRSEFASKIVNSSFNELPDVIYHQMGGDYGVA